MPFIVGSSWYRFSLRKIKLKKKSRVESREQLVVNFVQWQEIAKDVSLGEEVERDGRGFEGGYIPTEKGWNQGETINLAIYRVPLGRIAQPRGRLK